MQLQCGAGQEVIEILGNLHRSRVMLLVVTRDLELGVLWRTARHETASRQLAMMNGVPPEHGATPRDLTLDDAQALLRECEIRRVAPLNVGAASLSFAGRGRDAVTLGTTAGFFEVRNLEMA